MLKTKFKQVYFIGIKGVGMTMLAQFLSQQGIKVGGSDVTETFMTDQVLKKAGIKYYNGFKVSNLNKQADLIVYSSAYNPKTNVELRMALQQKNIPVLSYAQSLAEVFNSYQGVAVVGSHGKTTISAWLSFVLKQTKQKPNALIGARVPQLKGSCLSGSSKYLVSEVDEYQNKLQYFYPQGVILSNIDWDHHDYFKSFADYYNVFADFVKKIPESGFLIFNYDDKYCRKLSKLCAGKVIGFSLSKKVISSKVDIWQLHSEDYNLGQRIFSIKYDKKIYKDLSIALLGEHNLANSLAVIAASNEMGVSVASAGLALAKFKGAARRQEILGVYQGAVIIDDYAHHPVEIQKTLQAIRDKYNNEKLTVVFHPHTFTRTKALLDEFSCSFTGADEVLVLDIYGSAREKTGGVSSQDLVKKMKAYNSRIKNRQFVQAIGNLKQASNYLSKNATKHQIIVLMGAGDVFRVAENLLKK